MTDQPPKSGISGLIAQVLGYVDRPWKAVAVIVFVIVGGVGWVIYDKRDQLLEAWLTPSAVTLKTDEVPAALEKLEAETGADLAQVWSVDLAANSQRFIAARRKDGQRPVIPDPRRLPVVVRGSDMKVLVDVLNGHPACGDINPSMASPVVRRLAERGMTRSCAIPIPPTPEAWVGVIYLTWVVRPAEPDAELNAVGAALEVAITLVRR